MNNIRKKCISNTKNSRENYNYRKLGSKIQGSCGCGPQGLSSIMSGKEYDFLYEGNLSYIINNNIIKLKIPKNSQLTTFEVWKDRNTSLMNREIFSKVVNNKDLLDIIKRQYTPTCFLVLSIHNQIQRLIFTMITVQNDHSDYIITGLLNFQNNLAKTYNFPHNGNHVTVLLWVDAAAPQSGWRPSGSPVDVGLEGTGVAGTIGDAVEAVAPLAEMGCSIL